VRPGAWREERCCATGSHLLVARGGGPGRWRGRWRIKDRFAWRLLVRALRGPAIGAHAACGCAGLEGAGPRTPKVRAPGAGRGRWAMDRAEVAGGRWPGGAGAGGRWGAARADERGARRYEVGAELLRAPGKVWEASAGPCWAAAGRGAGGHWAPRGARPGPALVRGAQGTRGVGSGCLPGRRRRQLREGSIPVAGGPERACRLEGLSPFPHPQPPLPRREMGGQSGPCWLTAPGARGRATIRLSPGGTRFPCDTTNALDPALRSEGAGGRGGHWRGTAHAAGVRPPAPKGQRPHQAVGLPLGATAASRCRGLAPGRPRADSATSPSNCCPRPSICSSRPLGMTCAQ